MTTPNKIIIEIRDGRKADLDEVVDLWEQLAKHHEAMREDEFALAWDSKSRWAEYLRLKFSEISTKLIVAEEEGKIIGFMLCMLSPNVPIFKERKIGVISDVFVLPKWRRKGVAEKMLAMGAKWFKKNKVRSVQLMVAARNVDARTVWRRLGFKPYMLYKRLDLSEIPDSAWEGRQTKVVRRKIAKRKSLGSRMRIRRGPS